MIAELIIAVITAAWLTAYAVTDIVKARRRRRRLTIAPGHPLTHPAVTGHRRGAA